MNRVEIEMSLRIEVDKTFRENNPVFFDYIVSSPKWMYENIRNEIPEGPGVPDEVVVYIGFQEDFENDDNNGRTVPTFRKEKKVLNVFISPRNDIEDAGMRGFNIIETIAHEFIHVYDFFVGKFQYGFGFFTWEGFDVRTLLSNVEYRDLPWEQRAFGEQNRIAIQCIMDLQKNSHFRINIEKVL